MAIAKNVCNVLVFVVICVIMYAMYKFIFGNMSLMEGMATNSEAKMAVVNDGIAGNAAAFAATIKAAVIKSQDSLLISKYQSEYETAILNMDDLISNLMLRAVLTAKVEDPMDAIKQLATLQSAKQALNYTMKFIDS